MIIYIFNEIIIFIQRIIYIFNKLFIFQQKNYFHSTNYLYIQRIIYISTKELFSFNELFIHSTNYLHFNERIIFIQPIKYIYSANELKYFNSTKWSLNIWSTKYKLENWNLVSNAHSLGWMFVTCKHWNWNWHGDWKYYIFPANRGDIVWVTASTKLRNLLITWSRNKCKALHQCSSAIPMTAKLDRVVTLDGGTRTFKVTWLLITWSRGKWKNLISALPQYLWPSNLAEW